jgi:hypothetical protein
MASPTTRAHAWWKPTGDTLAAYLSLEETRRMIASSAALAPPDWQQRAKKTLGERLGRLAGDTLRAGVAVGTLGLSELMFRLSRPGLLTANEDIPPLDLVIGPTEAAVLISDGAVREVLTAQRLATHSEWERLDRLFGQGPHLEVVMIDLAPVPLVIPLCVVLGQEELRVQVDVDVAFGLEGADRVLSLLARSGNAVEGAELNAPEGVDGDRASFVTAATLAERTQRRLEHRVARMRFAQSGATALQQDPALLHQAESELSGFLMDELGVYGIVVNRCQLLLGRTEEQQLAIDRRRGELEQERKAMQAQARTLEERRQAKLDEERRLLEKERAADELAAEGELQQLGESNRLGLARMVSLNDQELARIEREGFTAQREDERVEELLDFRQSQLLLREERVLELEGELAGAQSELDTGRIHMQLEREKLEVASLAQDQNLAKLRQLKEIEREDDLLRAQAKSEAERERLAAAKDLSPEQMMAALADRDPEIARAMAARFGSEAEFARKSAEEQKELMREMQAQMAELMQKGLDANATVASGLVGVTRTGVERAPVVIDNRSDAAPAAPSTACRGCGEKVESGWKVCPFCGEQQARA